MSSQTSLPTIVRIIGFYCVILCKLQAKSRGDHTISTAGLEGECNILVAGEILFGSNTTGILLEVFSLWGYKV